MLTEINRDYSKLKDVVDEQSQTLHVCFIHILGLKIRSIRCYESQQKVFLSGSNFTFADI